MRLVVCRKWLLEILEPMNTEFPSIAILVQISLTLWALTNDNSKHKPVLTQKFLKKKVVPNRNKFSGRSWANIFEQEGVKKTCFHFKLHIVFPDFLDFFDCEKKITRISDVFGDFRWKTSENVPNKIAEILKV